MTRALLGAKNFSDVNDILTDSGTGIGDGVSVNFTFLNDINQTFYNAEVGPAHFPKTHSLVHMEKGKIGEHFYHCNRSYRIFSNFTQKN